MRYPRSLKLAVLVATMIGLSGCDNGSTTTVTSAPQDTAVSEEPIASDNSGVSGGNTGTNESATSENSEASNTDESSDHNEASQNEEAPIEYGDSTYSTFTIEESAHAMTNNGSELIYATVDGLLYSLNPATGESTFLYDVNPFNDNLLIGGLSYIGNNQFFIRPYATIQLII